METMKDENLMKNGEEEEEKEKIFHVLAVDDSQIERKILEKLLSNSSYQVTSVESGNKALEYLGLLGSPTSSGSCEEQDHGTGVNLIMTDYSMPEMTGYDLLKRIKKSYCRDVPVIVMSSENVPSRIHMCLEEGAEEFLLKPVQLADLKKLQPYVARSLRCCCDDNSVGGNSEVRFGLIDANTSIAKNEEKDLNDDECQQKFGKK